MQARVLDLACEDLLAFKQSERPQQKRIERRHNFMKVSETERYSRNPVEACGLYACCS